MATALSDQIRQLLAAVGCRDAVIAKCTMETRLYHDLRVYGDEAWVYLEILSDQFDVDLSRFDFDRYFPREFPGDSVVAREVYSILPWLYRLKRKRPFEPITLGMIHEAITCKKWSPPCEE